MNDPSTEYGTRSAVVTKPGPSKILYLIVGLLLIMTIATVAFSAATLGVVVADRSSQSTDKVLSLSDQIRIDDLIKHLEQLQNIADQSSGTRAITTYGFNGTLDYIATQLEQNTNFKIQHQYFTVRNYLVKGVPQLQVEANSNVKTYTYLTDFSYIVFSARASFSSFIRLVTIPSIGCTDADWAGAGAAGAVALVKRGCAFSTTFSLAKKYDVTALLIFNDGTSSDRFQPVQGLRANLDTDFPAFFLSYELGVQLQTLVTSSGGSVGIKMNIDVSDAEGIGNICADTPFGDKTKTIVVGAHSDGVPAGSGINDNGRGSIGILVLALNLARLFQTSSSNYPPYPYRIRFCWWGAEEIGLLGSIYHVDQSLLSSTTTEGERFSDYLLNFNYDMLAGPNFIFGIHNGASAPAATPDEAREGTNRITNVFRQWFTEQKLPWSNASLGGGSDYVPFLAKGLAVGGVNTGASGIKSDTERDRYSAMLGTGNAGVPNAAFDPCYHQKCDRIRNINPFAYEKVVKSAAYALEYVARLNDLEKWLYPQGRSKSVGLIDRNQLFKTFHDPDAC